MKTNTVDRLSSWRQDEAQGDHQGQWIPARSEVSATHAWSRTPTEARPGWCLSPRCALCWWLGTSSLGLGVYHDLEVGVGGPPRLPTLLPAGLEEVPRGCRNKTLLPKSGDHVAALPGAGLWASGCSHRPPPHPPQEGLLYGDRKAWTSRTAQQAGSGLPGTCMSRLPRPWPP